MADGNNGSAIDITGGYHIVDKFNRATFDLVDTVPTIVGKIKTLFDAIGTGPISPKIDIYRQEQIDGSFKLYTAIGLTGDVSVSKRLKAIGSTGLSKAADWLLPNFAIGGSLSWTDDGQSLDHGELQIHLPDAISERFNEWKNSLGAPGSQPELDLQFSGKYSVQDAVKADDPYSRIDVSNKFSVAATLETEHGGVELSM